MRENAATELMRVKNLSNEENAYIRLESGQFREVRCRRRNGESSGCQVLQRSEGNRQNGTISIALSRKSRGGGARAGTS